VIHVSEEYAPTGRSPVRAESNRVRDQVGHIEHVGSEDRHGNRRVAEGNNQVRLPARIDTDPDIDDERSNDPVMCENSAE